MIRIKGVDNINDDMNGAENEEKATWINWLIYWLLGYFKL